MKRISLNRSVFQKDPDTRFAQIRGVESGLLNDLYMRQGALQYSITDLEELFYIRTKNRIDRKRLWTWLKWVEVYRQAQVAIKTGAMEVSPEFFNDNESFVVKELTKNKHE